MCVVSMHHRVDDSFSHGIKRVSLREPSKSGPDRLAKCNLRVDIRAAQGV